MFILLKIKLLTCLLTNDDDDDDDDDALSHLTA